MSKLTDFDRKPTGLTDWPPHMEQYHWSSFESKQEREEAKNRLYRDTLNNVAFRTYNPAWQDAEHELRAMNLQAERDLLRMKIEQERERELSFLRTFHTSVTKCLDEHDIMWRSRMRMAGEATSAVQHIAWLFDANTDLKHNLKHMTELRDHYRNERNNQRDLAEARTIKGRFKRLFEFLSLHKSVDER